MASRQVYWTEPFVPNRQLDASTPQAATIAFNETAPSLASSLFSPSLGSSLEIHLQSICKSNLPVAYYNCFAVPCASLCGSANVQLAIPNRIAPWQRISRILQLDASFFYRSQYSNRHSSCTINLSQPSFALLCVFPWNRHKSARTM